MDPTEKSGNNLADRLRSLRIDRNARERASTWPRFLACVLVLACILGVAVFQLQSVSEVEDAALPATSEARAEQPEPSPPVQADWVIAGYLKARRQSLVSAEVTAKVTELLVEEGSVVHKDQPIARLDSALAEADLRIAQSRASVGARTVEAALAELNEAKRVLQRTRNLSEQSVSSRAALTKAQTRVETLTARHLEAEAKQRMAVREAERAVAVVAKHTILAPFSGAVTDCTAQVGETISPMSSGGSIRNGICTIVDTASIEIELDVPETMINRVRVGAKAQAFLDAYPADGLTAKVRAIAPIANREKSTIKVRLGFETLDPRLRPNMAIKVNLQTLATETNR